MKPAAVIPRLAIFSLLLGAALCAGAQSTGQPQHEKIAPNAWMKTPTPMSSPDPVPAPVRALRDQYWDRFAPAREPLSQFLKHSGVNTEEGVWYFTPQTPELPALPHRAVLTGTFLGFRSVMTTSERMIYTDMIFRVHDLLEDKTDGKAAPGPEITISVIGGTVRTGSGEEISYLTHQPWEYFLQPKHTYLLVLPYHADGDFYSGADSWDISDGIVRANSGRSDHFARNGSSAINGKSTAEMLRILRKQLNPPDQQ